MAIRSLCITEGGDRPTMETFIGMHRAGIDVTVICPSDHRNHQWLADAGVPTLDLRLQQLFIEQVATLAESTRGELEDGWRDSSSDVEVISATPLDGARQQAVRGALENALGPCDRPWRFSQDDSLIAGLRVSFGGWLLEANLKDELRFFAEAAHG